MQSKYVFASIYKTAIILIFTATAYGSPSIICDNPVYNFGSVPDTTTITHTFILQNAGDANLIISKVKKGCSCSDAIISTNVIPPRINFTLTTKHHLKNRQGQQRLSVYLHTNDPKNPYFQLQCSGEVLPHSKSSISALSSATVHLPSTNYVEIEFFFESGCVNCAKIKNNIFPSLDASFHGRYIIKNRDIGVLSNYITLVHYMNHAGIKDNADVFIVINKKVILAGYNDIAKNIYHAISACLTNIHVPSLQSSRIAPNEIDVLYKRLKQFQWFAIMFAGLVDGINPCAISTIIFLISFLVVVKADTNKIMMVGILYCLSSFFTYFAIGFGAFRVIHLSWAFPLIREGITLSMAIILGGLAFFSFRDAIRFNRSISPREITLRMPDKINRLVHSLIRHKISKFHLAVAAIGLGSLVTAIESICTGQVYIPTLVYLVKADEKTCQSLFYLVLYNMAFVLPLLIVFLLVWRGMQLETLVAWSRNHVVISKLIMGTFFLLLALVVLLEG